MAPPSTSEPRRPEGERTAWPWTGGSASSADGDGAASATSSTVDDPDRTRDLTVVVLVGGDAPHPDLRVPAAGLVVAADSGAERAAGLGLRVDVLVGDLDSVGDATVAAVRAHGGRIQRHHPDKDATDLELALAVVVAAGPARIVVVGGHGGRLDHALALPGALAAAAAAGPRVEAWAGAALVQVVTDEVRVASRPGEQVSLLAWGGPAHGVTTEGLRWPLRGATLDGGSTRGVSNEALGPGAVVSVTAGTLLVIRPHALAPEADGRPPIPDRPAAG